MGVGSLKRGVIFREGRINALLTSELRQQVVPRALFLGLLHERGDILEVAAGLRYEPLAHFILYASVAMGMPIDKKVEQMILRHIPERWEIQQAKGWAPTPGLPALGAQQILQALMLPNVQFKCRIRHEAQISGALVTQDVTGKSQPGAQFDRRQRRLLGLAAKHPPVQPHHSAFARAHARWRMTP